MGSAAEGAERLRKNSRQRNAPVYRCSEQINRNNYTIIRNGATMMSTLKKLFIFSMIAMLFLSACAGGAPQGNAPEPAEAGSQSTTGSGSAQAEEKPSPTPIEIPTSTPTLEPTAAPSASQDELIEKWRSSIGIFALISGICESTLETVNKAEEGQISSSELSGELFGTGILIMVIDEAVSDWEPSEELQEYKQPARDHVDAINNLMDQWSNDQLTAAEVADRLTEECKSIEETAKEIVSTASEEGLSQVSLEAIVQEIEESLSETPSEEEAAEAIPTEEGLSRSNPVPFGELYSAANWDLQVLDVIRGDEAWQMIGQANQFNEPPQDGMEYVLVKIKAASTAADSEEHSIGNWDFNLTGSQLIQYDPGEVVAPDPVLDATLYAGGEAEGWVAFAVGQDEDNLILVFDEMASWDEDRFRFFAIEEGASLSIPEDLRNIQPTDSGTDRSSPAPLGETVVTEDWEVTVTDVIRGEEAWQMIQEANQFNDTPQEGMQYVLVEFQVRYIGISNTAASIESASFKSTGSKNTVYDAPAIVDPEPAMDVSLFPGGVYEGWVTLSAAEDESSLSAIFSPWADFGTENRRFLSLEE
jgi:hypothetical protein